MTTSPGPGNTAVSRNPKTQKLQLFVSYSRSDRLAVDQLVHDLRRRHYVLWMDVDERGIEPGEDWAKELEKQMSGSEGAIACISPDFLRSKYCQAEIEQAKRENKPIYPVIVRRLDEGQSLASMDLAHLQYVDLTQDYRAGLRRLMLVLPRPIFPARLVAQRIGLVFTAVIALFLLFLVIAVGTGFSSILFPESRSASATPVPPTPTPSVEGYDIGVVVAKFAVPQGESIDVEEADRLVEQFGRHLEAELTEALSQMERSLGYLGPQNVRRIEGIDFSEREKDAVRLADDYGADIVVYGVIWRDDKTGQVTIQPEYYVDPNRLSDALEMTGPYRFGDEIAIDEPISKAYETESALSARTTALTYVVIGLSKYLTEDYEGALASFELAEGVPDWEKTEGREVLYILLGNAHLKLAQEAASRCERSTVLKQVDVAKEAYTTARDMKPDYSRPYAGLASATLLLALWTPEENEGCNTPVVDLNLLDSVLNYVEQALNANDQPKEVGVQTKLLFTKAQALFFQWNTEEVFSEEEYDQLYDDFRATTQQIILNYEEERYPPVAPLVVEVYILRGYALQTLTEYRAALEEYGAALEIRGISASRRMFVIGWQGDCYYELGQLTKAAEAYGGALKIAEEIQNDHMAAIFAKRQAEVDRELQAGS
jgi:tetratricopeptide (TPR) repeat protein